MKKNEEIQEDDEEKMISSGKRVGKNSTLFLEQKKFENFGEDKGRNPKTFREGVSE